jgi:adenylate cyclase
VSPTRFVITELLGLNSIGVPRRLELTAEEQIVGRSEQADLVIPLRTISRRHASIWLQEGQAQIKDLGSQSGTFVNSSPVPAWPTVLRQGDLISFGPHIVFLVSQEEVAEPATISNPIAPLTGDALAELALASDSSDSACRRYVDALMQLSEKLGMFGSESQLLAATLDSLEQAINAQRFFAMLGADPGELTIGARKLVSPEQSGQWGLPSREILRRALSTDRPVICFDAQSDERFCRRTSIAMSDVHSAVCVGLRLDQDCIGVLYADHQVGAGLFSLEDGRFMQAIARIVTTELLRLRAYSEIRRLCDTMERDLGYGQAGHIATTPGVGQHPGRR